MLLGGVAMLTSCSTDNDSNPVVKSPTAFTINASPVADQYIQLSSSNKVNLTWSQPDFGYNAYATYKVQVGIVNNGTVTWNEKDGSPKFLSTPYTACNANISGEEIAQAICELDGFKDVDSYVDMGFREIALRIYACIQSSVNVEVAGTGIMSDNYVTFPHMAAYCAIKSPAYIYLVGNPTGWAEPNQGNLDFYADWRLWEKEDEIGSNVFYGTFELAAGDLQFRFYRALTGWDTDSMGPQTNDAGVPSTFDSKGFFSGSILTAPKSKGTWLFSGFAGGTVEMTVDLNQQTVKFQIQ